MGLTSGFNSKHAPASKYSKQQASLYCLFRMKKRTISDLNRFLRLMARRKAVSWEITLISFNDTEVEYGGHETRNKLAALRGGSVKSVIFETVQ